MRQRPSTSSPRKGPQKDALPESSRRNGASRVHRKQRKHSQKEESTLECVKDFLAIFVITVCFGFWFILMWKLLSGVPTARRVAWNSRTKRTLLFQGADMLDPTSELRLPTPIVVVGLPKSGTTSISGYFRCGRIASSHFSCEVGEQDSDSESAKWRNCRLPMVSSLASAGQFPLCATCVERNIIHGRPPLEGCGPYIVFAELDSAEHPLPSPKNNTSRAARLRSSGSQSLGVIPSMSAIEPLCLYPQITHLDELHAAYPNATFILNTRPVDRWIKSISRWNGDETRSEQGYLRQVLTKCTFAGFPSGVGGTDKEMTEFYNSHSERIRGFVRKNPSHNLVEIDIEEDGAAAAMEAAFGISSTCWKQHNPSLQAQEDDHDPSSAGSSDDDDDDDSLSAFLLKTSSKSNESSTEVMAKLQKEKPNTRLITEYPACEGVEDLFPRGRYKAMERTARRRREAIR